MATKHTDTCLQKAGDDEPIFVLRAQDKLAAKTVRYWATLAAVYGVSDEKCLEARALAERMEQWPDRKYPD